MAENSRSESLHSVYSEALSRFDHFVMGVTVAVCGYLAQSNPYAKVGWNLPTLYLLSLLFFAAAAFCGYKRLEQTIQVLKHNVTLLECQEAGRGDKVAIIRPVLYAAVDRTNIYYKARAIFLLLGLVTYVLAKVLGPYATP